MTATALMTTSTAPLPETKELTALTMLTTGPENLVLEQLRAIREDIERLSNRVETIAVEMTAIRHHTAGMQAVNEHDHQDIAQIKARLERVENHVRDLPKLSA